ncbi:putative darA domain protein (plasmid) [Escherichia coli]|nr:putative darA domain protein [Escherichia coli]
MAGEDRYLMTESNTLEEIEATFFYDTPTTGVLRIYWRRLFYSFAVTPDHAGICPGIEPEAEWYRNLCGE